MKTKYYFLTLLFLCSPKSLWSQEYSVTYSSETFTPLSLFYVVNESSPEFDGSGNEIYGNIPIGFDFEIFGETFDSLLVGESGYIRFRSNGVDKSFISMFECELKDFDDIASNSPILYYTSGAPGDRIFTCEFVQKGFVNDAENNDYTHFQIRLFENCHDFEVHIGLTSIEFSETDLFFNNNPAPFIGFGNDDLAISYELTGGYSLPQLDPSSGGSLASVPPNGTVYNFSKCTANIDEVKEPNFSISPNPTSDFAEIKFDPFYDLKKIEVVNMQGQVINSFSPTDMGISIIDLSGFDNGVYIINVHGNAIVKSKKVVKR